MTSIRNSFLPATLFFGLLLTGLLSANQHPLTASVNRTILNEGEALQLTIRSEGGSDLEPDLSPLEEDFEILGRSSRQSYENINGKSRHTVEWQLSLMPQATGRLVIPALKGGGYETTPISIEVLDSSQQQQGQNNNLPPVFIKTELSQDKPYVQEEVILTLRIFYSVQLDSGSQLTPLEADNLVVKQLGDAQSYDTVVNGQRLGVYEVRYALYPQTSGSFTLPRQVFASAIAVQGNPFGSGFFGMQSGRPIQIKAPVTKLEVQSIPESWPGGPWLPARNVTLTTQWGDNADSLKAGDAVTRTITLTAEGLTGDQLPPLQISETEHIRRYPDKSVNNEQLTEQGLVGRRSESDALIPEQAGSLKVPPVKVRWFNTVSRQVEIAQSPGRTLHISPSPAEQIAVPPLQASGTDIVMAETQPPASAVSPENIRLWQIMTCIFAFLWLVTLGFLIYQRKQLKTTSGTPKIQVSHSQESIRSTAQLTEKQSRKQLQAAIKSARPAAIRQQMIEWCRIRFNQPGLTTLEGCVHCSGGNRMKNAFHKLEEAIYNQSGHYDPSELERAYDSWLNDLKTSNDNNAGKRISGSLYPAEKTGYR